MTPEERFQRIDETLERVGKRLDDIAARQDKFEIELEIQNHAWNERFNQLWKAHSALMDAQNTAWAAINQLTANIERLMRGPGSNGKSD
jgi:chromosome segregation ATPase